MEYDQWWTEGDRLWWICTEVSFTTKLWLRGGCECWRSWTKEMQSEDEGFETVVQGHSKAVGSRQQWRLGSGERNEVQETGKAKVPDRFSGSCFSGRSRRAHLACGWRGSGAFFHRRHQCGKPKMGAVGEDFHAIFQATYKGVEEPEWEATLFQCKELHQAVESKKSRNRVKTKGHSTFFGLEKEAKKLIFGLEKEAKKLMSMTWEDPNEVPSKVGPLDSPFEEPYSRIGKMLGRSWTRREIRPTSPARTLFLFDPILTIATGFRVATVVRTKTETQAWARRQIQPLRDCTWNPKRHAV